MNKSLSAASPIDSPLARTLIFFAGWLVSFAVVRFVASKSLELASMTVEPALLGVAALTAAFFIAWAGLFLGLQWAGGREQSQAAREARKSAGWAAAIALPVAFVAAVIGYLTASGG